MKKLIQIHEQFNTVYKISIDMDVTIGSNFYNTDTYNIQGVFDTFTKASKLTIVQIDSYGHTGLERKELSKWCKKNGYDYKEIKKYIINNLKVKNKN